MGKQGGRNFQSKHFKTPEVRAVAKFREHQKATDTGKPRKLLKGWSKEVRRLFRDI